MEMEKAVEVTLKLTPGTIKRAAERVMEQNYSIISYTAAIRHLVSIGAEEYIDHE